MALGDLIRLPSSFGVQLRRYLSYRPDEKNRIFRLLDYASTGSPGHGPIHLLLQSAEEIFFWDSEQAGWIQVKVAADLCRRKGFRGGFSVDIYGSHQLLVSSHPRERDKMLLRAILSGGVWNGFWRTSIVGFVMLLTMTVIYSGIALFPPLWNFVAIRNFLPFNEQGSHPLASLPPLAWFASWADF